MRSLVLLAAVLLGGCASTYDELSEPVHRAFYDGRPDEAVSLLEQRLAEADDEDQLLLRLELASALAAAGRHAEASEQLMAADDGLEVLDYTSAPVEAVADVAFGLDATWRASPPERVMVNTQNMLAFLAAGDLSGAAVEARRLAVLLTQADVEPGELYANGFAWGLAGLVLEARGDRGQAREAFDQLGPQHPLRPPEERPGDHGTLLVVAQLGKAPIRREATYFLTVGGRPHPLALPVLQRRPGGAAGASVRVDDGPARPLPLAFDYGHHVMERYDDELPRLLAAAAFQTLGRALAGNVVAEGLKQAGEDQIDEDDDDRVAKQVAVSVLAEALAFLFEWGVSEAQTTDTRCWSLLPERLHALRLDLPAGVHTVTVQLEGLGPATTRQVTVEAGGLTLVQALSATREGWLWQEPPRGSDLTHTTAGSEALRLIEGISWEVHRFDR